MPRQSRGWVKGVGIGCLVVVILTATFCYVAYRKVRAAAPKMIADFAEASAEALFTGLALPEDETEAALAVVRAFAADIRDGKITLDEGRAVARALADPVLLGVIGARGFEMRYVAPSELTDAEKRAAHVTVTRFAEGLRAGRIPPERMKGITESISEEIEDARGRKITRLKASLSPAELAEVLKQMKSDADAAGIEEREHPYSVADEMRQAIEKGLGRSLQPATVPASQPVEPSGGE